MTTRYYKDETGDQLVCLDGILIYTDDDETIHLTLVPTPNDKQKVVVDKLCDNKCGKCLDHSCGAAQFMEDDSR